MRCMVKLTASEIAEKWRRHAEGAVADYKKGVEKVSVSPTEKAANKQEKMKANLMKAIDEGKWAKGLRSVSLEDWKKITAEKGSANYGTGVRIAESKMEDFMAEVLPHIESGQRVIEGMADITLADSKARAVAWIDHMSKFKRSKYK